MLGAALYECKRSIFFLLQPFTYLSNGAPLKHILCILPFVFCFYVSFTFLFVICISHFVVLSITFWLAAMFRFGFRCKICIAKNNFHHLKNIALMNDSGKWSMNGWWYCSWLLCIYGCVFFPLLSTAFTVMRICVFSADWWYCSWLSCIFVCFLTIDDIALDFYADLPKVQLRQMQGHGPYLSFSTFNTSISKKKGKRILIIKPAATNLYASIGFLVQFLLPC